jgi:hypothetical protein
MHSSPHSPSQLPFPTNPAPQTSPNTNTIPALFLSPHSPSQLPFTTNQTPQAGTLPYTVPAILCRGKGKSKLVLGNDDIPLAQLKKIKMWTESLCKFLIRLRDYSIISH